MAVKIRLQRKGRKKRPFYHIVVADARSPRDGRYIERLGTYNPMTKPATIDIDRDKAFEWLMNGAQPTDTARAILRFKGIYFKKHLMRGVKKGALTVEQAEAMHKEWVDAKEAKIAARVAKTKEEQREFHAMVSGTTFVPPPPPVVFESEVEEEIVEAAQEEVAEVEETVQEEAAAEEETVQEEVTAVEDAAQEEVAEAEETPQEEETKKEAAGESAAAEEEE
jgi:small subunit ribosomal protein S16